MIAATSGFEYALAVKTRRIRNLLAELSEKVVDDERLTDEDLRFLVSLNRSRRGEWIESLPGDKRIDVAETVHRFGTQKQRCTKSLWDFSHTAWPIVEPGIEFVDNWHIRAICWCLENLHQNQLYELGASCDITEPDELPDVFANLLINIPPGCMKSYLVSVFFPCWVWTHNPSSRFMFASTTAELSGRDSRRRRKILQSDWYQRHWGDRVQLKPDQNQKMRFDSTAEGYMYSTSVGGTAVGEHMDYLVIDDPHNPEDAMHSETEREEVIGWWKHEIALRGVGRGVRRILIMQRLHADDLAGHVLQHEKGWYHLKFPMRFNKQSKPAEFDPRTQLDELLYPQLFPKDIVENAEIRLGKAGTEGQYQQDPPEHFMGYEWPEEYFDASVWFDSWPSPNEIVLTVMATDPSLGRSDKSDYSAIVTAKLHTSGRIYVDADIDRRPPRQIVKDAFRLNVIHVPQSFVVETNGFQALLETFVHEEGKTHGMLPPFFGVVHSENKDERIRGECGYHLAKREIRFKSGSPGALLLVDQLRGFPSSKRKKDGPDALAMAIRRLRQLWSEMAGQAETMEDEQIAPL